MEQSSSFALHTIVVIVVRLSVFETFEWQLSTSNMKLDQSSSMLPSPVAPSIYLHSLSPSFFNSVLDVGWKSRYIFHLPPIYRQMLNNDPLVNVGIATTTTKVPLTAGTTFGTPVSPCKTSLETPYLSRYARDLIVFSRASLNCLSSNISRWVTVHFSLHLPYPQSDKYLVRLNPNQTHQTGWAYRSICQTVK